MKYVGVLVVLFLSACGGGGGGAETTPTTHTTKGVWVGTINSTPVVAIIDDDLTAFVTDFADVLWLGTATISGQTISIATTQYNDSDNGSSVTLTGTANSNILTLTTPAGSSALTYHSGYEKNSSLALTTGSWSIVGSNNYGTDMIGWTITVLADGSFSGQFGNGCMANGQLSIINSAYTAYALELTMTLCGSQNGNYTGSATLTDENPGTNNSLSFAFGNGTDGFYFDDIRKN